MTMLWFALILAAQVGQSGASQSRDEIIVTGERMDEYEPVVRQVHTGALVGVATGAFDEAQRFVKCAAPRNLDRIREVIDGVITSSSHGFAITSLRSRNRACVFGHKSSGNGITPSTVIRTNDVFRAGTRDGQSSNASQKTGEGTIIDEGLFVRGAILDYVLENFAAPISLTKAKVDSPSVRARFTAVETPRNRLRYARDTLYFKVAICMVREQPILATRLVESAPQSREEGYYRARLIDDARMCVGGARKVTVNPVEFRIYVADALYRWLVAARNVPSLIPISGGAG